MGGGQAKQIATVVINPVTGRAEDEYGNRVDDPNNPEMKSYRHKEKVDGSLATQKEEERRQQIEEMRRLRKLEILRMEEELRMQSERFNYFLNAVDQPEVKEKKKKRKDKKKKDHKKRKASKSKKRTKSTKSKKTTRSKSEKKRPRSITTIKKRIIEPSGKSKKRRGKDDDSDDDGGKVGKKGGRNKNDSKNKKDKKPGKDTSKVPKKYRREIKKYKEKPKKKIMMKNENGDDVEVLVTDSNAEDDSSGDDSDLAGRFLKDQDDGDYLQGQRPEDDMKANPWNFK